ncbi:MAG: hypothetical protein C5B52_14200 [Bacteroidetes bacterium]|nr:MAG: hypothetical protein C5B52_14200 [Bacteroidota bacterium]
MCTVTFIPAGDSIFITSNRDEQNSRLAPVPPAIHSNKTGNILMPRDPHAGGTWMGLHENGNAIVFLNGAFMKHKPNPPYKKSRGLILIDLLDSKNILKTFHDINLNFIEPFTAIIWEDGQLYDCKWDGSKKYRILKNGSVPHIWSSSTLYDEGTALKRESWFQNWLSNTAELNQQSILKFHLYSGDGDLRNALVMERDGLVSTFCISALQINNLQGIMTHQDLKQGKTWKENISLTQQLSFHE